MLCMNMKVCCSLFWDVTQRRLVVGVRRFGTIYRSHAQDFGLTDP